MDLYANRARAECPSFGRSATLCAGAVLLSPPPFLILLNEAQCCNKHSPTCIAHEEYDIPSVCKP